MPVPKPESDFQFRVAVDFLERPDYIVPFRTQGECDDYIAKIFRQGYAVIDRSGDESNIYSVIVPIGQVRSITVHDAPR